jgi:hypothetical protein
MVKQTWGLDENRGQLKIIHIFESNRLSKVQCEVTDEGRDYASSELIEYLLLIEALIVVYLQYLLTSTASLPSAKHHPYALAPTIRSIYRLCLVLVCLPVCRKLYD